MTRYRTGPRRAWTEDDSAWLLALADEGLSQSAMARLLKRTISSVEGKLRLLRMEPLLGPGQSRYEKPEAIESDDTGHLEGIVASNGGQTFPVVAEPVLAKLYAFERSIPKRRAA